MTSQILNQQERRVKIVNYSTKKELEDAIDDKTYIIEGFGIRNNDVPIKDISGKNLVIDTQDGRWAKVLCLTGIDAKSPSHGTLFLLTLPACSEQVPQAWVGLILGETHLH